LYGDLLLFLRTLRIRPRPRSSGCANISRSSRVSPSFVVFPPSLPCSLVSGVALRLPSYILSCSYFAVHERVICTLSLLQFLLLLPIPADPLTKLYRPHYDSRPYIALINTHGLLCRCIRDYLRGSPRHIFPVPSSKSVYHPYMCCGGFTRFFTHTFSRG
jgi:hypothetical protein